ncbi:MAG: uncharacterized protein A8A55_3041, partial [Amphiamblys sp. WSBS2006]
MSNWSIHIKHRRKTIGEIQLTKGILQGDSLSPLLFVLVMEPLSRQLNSDSRETNHLLYVDDIKLMADTEVGLKQLLRKTIQHTGAMGLEINRDKSATNTPQCEGEYTKLLREEEGYKYLGVYEDRDSQQTKETKETVTAKILKRVERLCDSSLNARNLTHAINEFAISVINYYAGLVEYTESEARELDKKIRSVLLRKKVHEKGAATERLYLPRRENGRGLRNVENQTELAMLGLWEHLQRRSERSDECKRVIATEERRSTPLAKIKETLLVKYNETKTQAVLRRDTRRAILEEYRGRAALSKEEEDELQSLKDTTQETDADLINQRWGRRQIVERQKAELVRKITEKVLHRKSLITTDYIDTVDATLWLRHGNQSPQAEARLVGVQDRNIVRTGKKCPHCRKGALAVEHLATKCTTQ